jgi:NAD(P)H-dependent FMN reductase
MNDPNKLLIPVILGTTRKGRMSEHVARFVLGELQKRKNIETTLVDVRAVPLAMDDEGESVKNPEISEMFNKAAGFVIITPEYNHGYPGSLKRLLDSNLKEYIHKPVGICGVSAGPFGGTRVIENMLSVMRELGLVTIFWDGNFSQVQKIFDADGKLLDQAFVRRMDKFIGELVWMATVLKHGRENVPLQ